MGRWANTVPGSPSDLNTGNGTEGAMVYIILGSLLRPLFYFLCSNLKVNPVQPNWLSELVNENKTSLLRGQNTVYSNQLKSED